MIDQSPPGSWAAILPYCTQITVREDDSMEREPEGPDQIAQYIRLITHDEALDIMNNCYPRVELLSDVMAHLSMERDLNRRLALRKAVRLEPDPWKRGHLTRELNRSAS